MWGAPAVLRLASAFAFDAGNGDGVELVVLGLESERWDEMRTPLF